jgi:predicted Zn-dependent protease
MTENSKNIDYVNKLIFVKAYEEAFDELTEMLKDRNSVGLEIILLRFIELGVKLQRKEETKEILDATMQNRDEALNEVSRIILNQHANLDGVQGSVEELQNHIKQFGASTISYYAIGFAYECMGNHERAIFNYELSIKESSDWHPSYFGLSQQYYAKNQDVLGDYYFYLSEKHAPYNLYGNFETHRNLCQFFINQELYGYARIAITTLSEWWLSNKGKCPLEVKLYEQFALARISKLEGKDSLATEELAEAKVLARLMVLDDGLTDSALYFGGKVVEEFGEFELALELYYRVIVTTKNFLVVQKLVLHLIDLGEFSKASEFIAEAYQNHPSNKDLEFLALMTQLKAANIDVDEYLELREKALEHSERGGSKVELLSMTNSLLVKFDRDARIHALAGDIYVSFSQIQRAAFHYQQMYELEKKDPSIAVKWSSWLLSQGQLDVAVEVLGQVDLEKFPESREEVLWAKANVHLHAGQEIEAQSVLWGLLRVDPWNVTYNVHYTLISQSLAHLEKDSSLEKLSLGKDESFDVKDFMHYSKNINPDKYANIIYQRSKIYYLYTNGSDESLQFLVKSGTKYDTKKATMDMLKLLNTNFDSIEIYFALADLYKDIWQLEVASVWLEQALLHPSLTEEHERRCWSELADCFLWQEINLEKALEYAKSGASNPSQRATTILAHAYLKLGKVNEARSFLDQLSASDPEVRYFKGLLEYRNGAKEVANSVWKPLLSMRSDNMRMHSIKRDVLKFYFEGAPYLRAN